MTLFYRKFHLSAIQAAFCVLDDGEANDDLASLGIQNGKVDVMVFYSFHMYATYKKFGNTRYSVLTEKTVLNGCHVNIS